MMKRILFAVIAVLICVSSYAQEKPKAFTYKEPDLKEIGCSDEQIAKILQLAKESQVRVAAIKADNSLTDEEKKEKLKAENKVKLDARRDVLTPEQLAKAKAITQERKANN